jgi:hypothetical protein
VAVFKNGDIYVATSQSHNASGHSLFQYDGTTYALLSSFAGPGGTATGGTSGAFLSPLGHLWIPDWNSSIQIRDAAGTLLRTITVSGRPETVVFDRAGFAYVGQQYLDQLTKFTLTGDFVGAYPPSAEGRGVDELAMGLDARTIYYTTEGDRVYTWDLVTNTQGPFVTIPGPVDYAYGVAVVPADGSILVAIDDGEWPGGRVDRFTAAGVFMQHYYMPTPTPYSQFFGVAVEPNSQYFWVGAAIYIGSEAVALRVNLASGALTQVLHTGVALSYVDGVIPTVMSVRSPMLAIS